MKKKLKISVITCCKNSMPYLKNNVISIEKQSYKNFEHLFIVSPSNDGTTEFLKIKKKEIYKFNSSNIYKCINYGIKKSKGDIVYLLHSDDQIISKNLFKKINNIFNDKIVDFLYGDCIITTRNNTLKILREWNSKKINPSNLFQINLPAHTTFFIKKNIFKKLIYNTNFKISSDFDFLIKLFKTYKGYYLNFKFIKMRTGGTSSRLKNFTIKMREDIIILKKHFFRTYFLIYILKLFFKLKQKIIF